MIFSKVWIRIFEKLKLHFYVLPFLFCLAWIKNHIYEKVKMQTSIYLIQLFHRLIMLNLQLKEHEKIKISFDI